MGTETDILIIGGGLNGPCLALALASAGIRSTLVDRLDQSLRDDPGFDGRAYALALGSCRMLGALGLWADLKDNAQPILDIKVADGKAGTGASPLMVHFDHSDLGEGPMGHLVEDRYLRQALLSRIAGHPLITQIAPATVVAQTVVAGEASVILDTGEVISARLLIGCDGRNSGTASRAGINRTGWGYDQTALVCALAHEKPHEGVAYQLFLPSGPLAILPLTGNRSSIVWTETTARAETIQALDDAGYMAELAPRIGSFLGSLTLEGDRFTYPLGLSLARRFVAERVALVGDAAHGIHPLAGQGLNLGLRDVAALAEVLVAAKSRGEDLGASDVLARYQQWRRFDTSALAVATDVINRVFSNDNPLLRVGRDLALGAAQAVAPVRRTMMREAAGLTGDLPRLMTGEPL